MNPHCRAGREARHRGRVGLVNVRNYSSFVDHDAAKVVGNLAVCFAAVADFRPTRLWQNEKKL
jgi:hypothetical protein